MPHSLHPHSPAVGQGPSDVRNVSRQHGPREEWRWCVMGTWVLTDCFERAGAWLANNPLIHCSYIHSPNVALCAGELFQDFRKAAETVYRLANTHVRFRYGCSRVLLIPLLDWPMRLKPIGRDVLVQTQKQRYQLEEVIRDKLAYIQEARVRLT